MDYEVSEQAVLAACLRDESGLSSAKACELLTEADFSTEAHQKILEERAKQCLVVVSCRVLSPLLPYASPHFARVLRSLFPI